MHERALAALDENDDGAWLTVRISQWLHEHYIAGDAHDDDPQAAETAASPGPLGARIERQLAHWERDGQPLVPTIAQLPEHPCHERDDGQTLGSWLQQEWAHNVAQVVDKQVDSWDATVARLRRLRSAADAWVTFSSGQRGFKLGSLAEVAGVWPIPHGSGPECRERRWNVPVSVALWLTRQRIVGRNVFPCLTPSGAGASGIAGAAMLRWWQESAVLTLDQVLDLTELTSGPAR